VLLGVVLAELYSDSKKTDMVLQGANISMQYTLAHQAHV
jgi:hypothetical protein